MWTHCQNAVQFIQRFFLTPVGSVAEPKLFIFGSGSDLAIISGSVSSSSYSHILALKTVINTSTILIEEINDLFFILASSKLTAENDY